jgi:flagellar basal body-associated protein FliL
MIIFAVFLIALVGFLIYFFVFSGKKTAEGKDLNQKLGEHP